MGFSWLCPECGNIHEYGGNATTKATARCGSKNLKIWQYRILPPKPPEKPPQATNKYETRARNPPSRISVEIDYNAVLKCMERGISTIENKPQIKAKKGSYYWDYLKWTEQFNILKTLRMGDEK